MIQVVGILLVIILALSGVASCEHKRASGLETAIAANKIEAKRILDDAIAKNAKREDEDKQRNAANQKDYDEKIASLAADNLKYAGRLRDPGRRDSGSCPASQAGTATGISQDATAGSELSPEAGIFLRAEADRANVAATYALECYRRANKIDIRQQVIDQRQGKK